MKKLLDNRKGAKPLYLQVKQFLLDSIVDGRWMPGDLIPTEVELMEMFGVSRMTVRQATNELVMENLLIRKSGVGTKVLESPKTVEQFFTSVKSFSSEVRETSFAPQTFYIQLHTVTANAALQMIFGDELHRKKLFRLDRVRGYNDKRIVYFETFLCTDVDLTQIPMDKDFSLYNFFERSGTPLHLIEEKITAKLADSKLAGFLDVEEGEAMLLRERFGVDSNGVLTEYSLGYYDAKDYAYHIRLLNR